MLLHGVKDTEFEIFHGDTLANDWDILRELNPAKKPSFDAVVANPPFSFRWEPTEAMGDDVRFKNYGLAENLADAMRAHPLAHVQQQRTRPTGKVQNARQALLLARRGFLAV